MKQHFKYPFILFFLSLSTLVFGQFTAPRFQRLTIADGLPNGEVDQIREDVEGFIWFSTAEGICRFDGYKMQILTGSDPQMTAALNADRPVFFDWDARKRWWIGSDWAGMRRFDPPKKEFRYLLTPFYAEYYGDKYKNLDTLFHSNISSILSDGNNRVWIGTEKGIAVFDIAKDRLDRNPQLATPLFKGHRIHQLTKDATGNIWALVRTKGLYRFDKTTQTWSTAVGHNDIRHFTFDKDGNILFVTSKELWQYNPKTKAKTQPFGAITKALTTKSEFFKIHQDKKGCLWLGTNSGLILLRGVKFRHKSSTKTRVILIRFCPISLVLFLKTVRGIFGWLVVQMACVCFLIRLNASKFLTIRPQRIALKGSSLGQIQRCMPSH